VKEKNQQGITSYFSLYKYNYELLNQYLHKSFWQHIVMFLSWLSNNYADGIEILWFGATLAHWPNLERSYNIDQILGGRYSPYMAVAEWVQFVELTLHVTNQ